MVLLKRYDDNGFVFFTNYTSRKGKELARNPYAALVFWWDILQRQVRIEGKVEKTTIQESELYFASRPRGSQLATCASNQSAVIPSRDLLEKKWQKLSEKYRSGKIPKPPEWGGFLLMPVVFEFWQGRAHRLHDRLRFTLQKNRNWKIERLSP
jgi:pyridoxamine 5'-phosphate oxidase